MLECGNSGGIAISVGDVRLVRLVAVGLFRNSARGDKLEVFVRPTHGTNESVLNTGISQERLGRTPIGDFNSMRGGRGDS